MTGMRKQLAKSMRRKPVSSIATFRAARTRSSLPNSERGTRLLEGERGTSGASRLELQERAGRPCTEQRKKQRGQGRVGELREHSNKSNRFAHRYRYTARLNSNWRASPMLRHRTYQCRDRLRSPIGERPRPIAPLCSTFSRTFTIACGWHVKRSPSQVILIQRGVSVFPSPGASPNSAQPHRGC